MKYILTVATSLGSKTVEIDATSPQEAMASYKPNNGDIVLAVEAKHLKAQRDAATTARAAEEMRIRRRRGI